MTMAVTFVLFGTGWRLDLAGDGESLSVEADVPVRVVDGAVLDVARLRRRLLEEARHVGAVELQKKDRFVNFNEILMLISMKSI